MRAYIAIVHKDPDSDFSVSFPDFPGCVTAGSTLAEAADMAAEALAGHVGLMVDEGEDIPEPSDIDKVMSDPDNRDGVAMLVPAPPQATKTIRVNITLPEHELAAIDRFSEQHGYTRSGFLLHAARKAMKDPA